MTFDTHNYYYGHPYGDLHFLCTFLVVEYIWKFIPAAGLVMGSEFVVDWFKHAFITKFNDIKPEVSKLIMLS